MDETYHVLSDTDWELNTTSRHGRNDNSNRDRALKTDHTHIVVDTETKRDSAPKGRRSARIAGVVIADEKTSRKMALDADVVRHTRKPRTRGRINHEKNQAKPHRTDQYETNHGANTNNIPKQPLESKEIPNSEKIQSSDDESTDEDASREPVVSFVVKPVDEATRRNKGSVISPYAIPSDKLPSRGNISFTTRKYKIADTVHKRRLTDGDTLVSSDESDGINYSEKRQRKDESVRTRGGGDLQDSGIVQWGDNDDPKESDLPPHAVRVSLKKQNEIEQWMIEEKKRISEMMSSKEYMYIDAVAGDISNKDISALIDHWDILSTPIELTIGFPDYIEPLTDSENSTTDSKETKDVTDDEVMNFILDITTDNDKLNRLIKNMEEMIDDNNLSSDDEEMFNAMIIVFKNIQIGITALTWQDRIVLREFLKREKAGLNRTTGGKNLDELNPRKAWFTEKWAESYIKAYIEQKRILDIIRLSIRPASFKWFKITSACKSAMMRALSSVKQTNGLLENVTVGDLIEDEQVRTMFATLTASFFNESQAVQQRRPFLKDTNSYILSRRAIVFNFFRKCTLVGNGVIYTGKINSTEWDMPYQTYSGGEASVPSFFI